MFLWPGFGENIRVLKWIFERTSERASAVRTAIGWLPESFDLKGLPVDSGPLFQFDKEEWRKEVEELKNYFQLFGDRLPQELGKELEELKKRLVNEK